MTLYTILFEFIIYSVAGYLVSMVINAASTGKFVNKGFLLGPYQPVIGIGAILIKLLLEPVSESLVLLFFCSFVIGSLIQYALGWGIEYLFRFRPWDYSNKPFNLGGYVCLSHSLIWGAVGTAGMKIVNPVVIRMYAYVSVKIGYTIIGIVAVVIITDLIINVISMVQLNKKLKSLADLSSAISSYIGEGKGEKSYTDSELKKIVSSYEAAASNNNVLHRRILLAYPEIKSRKYNRQLQDIKEYAEKIKETSDEVAEKRREKTIAKYEEVIAEGEEKPFAYGLCFSKLFWVFLAGNVIGFIVETLWCLAVSHHFEWRVGLVYGPFIPVYGFGAVIITLCLYRFYSKREIWIFTGSALIGAAFEYACSLFQELAFGTVSWEYSDTPLNIGGRTNLMFALCWGVLGLLWVRDLYPLMSKTIEKIPKRIGMILTALLCVFMIYDMGISSLAVARQTERRQNIPAQNAVDEYLDRTFNDEFLNKVYPNMIYIEQDTQ